MYSYVDAKTKIIISIDRTYLLQSRDSFTYDSAYLLAPILVYDRDMYAVAIIILVLRLNSAIVVEDDNAIVEVAFDNYYRVLNASGQNLYTSHQLCTFS